jgi:large subunit ribosomal protein L25
MEKVILDAELRDTKGRHAAKRLRRQNYIPAVLYGKSLLKLRIRKPDFIKLLHEGLAENSLVELKIKQDGKRQAKTTIVKEIQHDPLKDEILHVDFHQISLTEAVVVRVPIVAKGEPQGAKKENAVLEHILWELEVECLPTEIPAHIEVDVSNLNVGDSIFVKDLKLSGDVKILNDPELIVFSLKPPLAEKVAEEEKPEEELTEPEVIKEKKEKPEEESE